MEKEKWIKEVFESTSNMEQAEPSPFLVEKIMHRVSAEKGTSGTVMPGMKWALGLAAVLVITVNLFSVGKLVRDKNEAGKVVLQKSMGINNEVIYNY